MTNVMVSLITFMVVDLAFLGIHKRSLTNFYIMFILFYIQHNNKIKIYHSNLYQKKTFFFIYNFQGI